MTASHNRSQYAVGVATNVFHNTEEDMELIADELNVFENWMEVWQLRIVQTRFKDDVKKFMTHWEDNYRWMRWKAPSEHFFWFNTPIRLNPARITGKKRLAAMHSKYQGIEPDKAIQIIRPHLPTQDHPCLLWLVRGEFDSNILPKGSQAKPPRKPKRPSHIQGPVPTLESFQYWVEGIRNVDPLHARLQAKFVRHLKSKGIKYDENINCVDVQYKEDGKTTFCEIKPTHYVPTKFAIRLAVGQLLEYRFRHNPKASLEIVLDQEPKSAEKSFVTSLGMSVTFWDENVKSFQTYLKSSS